MKITWWGCAWGIWEGQSCHCNLNNTKKTVGVLLYSKNICCIACPLAVLKPDLEIFKAVKSSQSSFKRKATHFPSHDPGLLFLLSRWDSGPASPKFIPWVSWRAGTAFCPSVVAAFSTGDSLKSLTFEIPGLLHLQCVVLAPATPRPRICAW